MKKTVRLAQLAILTAIIAIMAFTPIGYLKTAGLEITFILIPVIVGAIVLGPKEGAFLGAVFGFTSFLQCVLGLSVFGATLLSISPILTFVVCFFPRLLVGLLCGLVFKALKSIDKTKIISYSVASVSGALFNTALFMGALMLLFGRTDYIQSFMKTMGQLNPIMFIFAFVGINGLIEAVVCFVIATTIAKAVDVYLTKAKMK